MRPTPNQHVEAGRIQQGPLASTVRDGNNGVFRLQLATSGRLVRCIVSDGKGWEHVSVMPLRGSGTLSWEEMTEVKDLFWEPEETVFQFHPPRSQYVNNASQVLHLWRPTDQPIALPPTWMVGSRKLGEL